MLGKSRRVENNEVVFVLNISHIGESLLCKRLVRCALGEIAGDIAAHQVDSLLAHVHGMHQPCASAEGINGKSAGVAEHIEDILAACIPLEQGTILALVDEKARFLPAQPVDTEGKSILHCPEPVPHIGGVAPNEIADALPVDAGFEGQSVVGFVVHITDINHLIYNGLRYFLTMKVHADGVRLHHRCVRIDVHHQSGQEIALAMDETISVVGGSDEPDSLAHLIGCLNALTPKITGQFARAKRQNPHGNRADLIVPDAQYMVVTINHLHQFALLRSVVGVVAVETNSANGPREDPRVETE